jgi:hypothetical protein
VRELAVVVQDDPCAAHAERYGLGAAELQAVYYVRLERGW